MSLNNLKQIIKHVVFKLSPKKCIIFESCPDLSDNTKAVFDEMINRGLNKKYILVWLVFDKNKDKYPKIKNVKYINKGEKIFSLYNMIAKCFVCCNRFLYQNNNYQKSYYLSHGMYVKCPTKYYSLPKEIDYCLSSSKDLEPLQAKALNVPKEKMVSLGFPRNDVLTKQNFDLSHFFNKKYSKYIVWYPTFRQHNSGMETGSEISVPIIWDEKQAIELNDCAKNNDVLIILKPHFAQDTTKIKSLNLSNIKFIDDDFFIVNNITSYQFLSSCDALLTDYSSVYFDYTLCDKPIGLVWEDYDDYEKNPGFAIDMDYYMSGGFKIYNLNDFKNFILEVSSENDSLKEQRCEIAKISNYSDDGQSSKRVVDFIIEKSNL